MVGRQNKLTSGWRPWALGAAAISMGCAAALFFLRRWASRASADEVYEAWWRHRDQIRSNGHRPSAPSSRSENPELFV
jgi:hypothetical protein